MPRTRVLAIAVALVLLTSVVARVAVAGIVWETFECCCGEHAGDKACGCPECPAGQHAESDEHDGDGAPSVKTCGPDGQLVLPTSLGKAIFPAVPPPITREVRAAAPPPLPRLRSELPPAPEPPPPRSVR